MSPRRRANVISLSNNVFFSFILLVRTSSSALALRQRAVLSIKHDACCRLFVDVLQQVEEVPSYAC